jgi:hypothetical protein
LFGCETWSLTLREERRLRLFENRVLRRIFGPKREEVAIFWWESEGKRPFGIPSRRWEYNIRMNLREIG